MNDDSIDELKALHLRTDEVGRVTTGSKPMTARPVATSGCLRVCTLTPLVAAVLAILPITAHANSVKDAKAAAVRADLARTQLAACQNDACRARAQATIRAAVKDEYDQLQDVIHSSSWHYHKAAKDWARAQLKEGFAAGIFTAELATEAAPPATDLVAPDGYPMYEADCDRDKACFEDISKQCPTGYEIVSQDVAHEGGLALASGGVLSVAAGSSKHGADIFYECKEAPEPPPAPR